MASRFECEFCGASGFVDFWALRGHQARNGLCLSRQRARKRAASEQMREASTEGPIGTTNPLEPNVAEEDIDHVSSAQDEDLDKTWDEPGMIQEQKVFDCTFQLVFFMRQCHNGGGLSKKDMNILLRLLHHPEFDVKKIQVKTAAQVCKYEESLTELNVGTIWKRVEMRQQSTVAPSIDLHFRNPLTVLEELFASPANKSGFSLRSTIVREGNQRVYTTLQTGEWWEEMEAEVQSQCAGGIVAPIILYSDQTSLSHNRRTQGWPLVMTLGNISCSLRNSTTGHALLGILPIVGANDPDVLNSRMPSRTKLEIFHMCEELILEPLKEASRHGIHLKDPFGQDQWVFPRLCLYICNQTEGSRASCTFDSNKSNNPCSSCFCPQESLSEVTKKFPYRTESKMKEIFEEMEQTCYGNLEDLSKQHSIHPVKCALWGFAGSDLTNGSPYRCIQLDRLHQSILGLFKTLVGIVRLSASSYKLVPHPLEELDIRIQTIQKGYRYASFRLPGNDHSGFFTSNANYHGFEYKFVMQVVVFCLMGVVPNSVIQVFVDFIEWYLLAFQSKQHMDESLIQMEKLMHQAVASMKKHVIQWQKSRFETIKIHAMSHLKDCIKRCGLPLEYDTGIYENLHIALMKIPYRHSNRRNFLGQVTRYNQRMKMLLEEVETHEDLRVRQEDFIALDKVSKSTFLKDHRDISLVPVKVNCTQMDGWNEQAVSTRQVVLSGKDLKLNMEILNYNFENLSYGEKQLCNSQPEIQQFLEDSLMDYMLGEDCSYPRTIVIWRGLAVPSGDGIRFADWPMYTRASPKFHGREWYGFVNLQVEAAGDDPITWTGQLRLLFSCETINHSSGQRVEKHLALVRLMEELPRHEDWKLLHCEKLKWVNEAVPGITMPVKKQKKNMNPTVPYIVLDIANVCRVVHVVPNFTQSGTYFLNRFKL